MPLLNCWHHLRPKSERGVDMNMSHAVHVYLQTGSNTHLQAVFQAF